MLHNETFFFYRLFCKIKYSPASSSEPYFTVCCVIVNMHSCNWVINLNLTVGAVGVLPTLLPSQFDLLSLFLSPVWGSMWGFYFEGTFLSNPVHTPLSTWWILNLFKKKFFYPKLFERLGEDSQAWLHPHTARCASNPSQDHGHCGNTLHL